MPPRNEVRVPESASELAQRLALPFADMSLLFARIDASLVLFNEHATVLEDNERLEFLGDAVLDFVVGAWVYHHCPEMPEGDLTRIRSALVRNAQLAEFARTLALGRALRMGRGEVETGGRERDGVLGSTFEAVVGAVFLDGGLPKVESFMQPLLESAKDRLLMPAEIYDAKSRLQEWSQSRKLGTPRYIDVASSGPDHAKIFEIEVRINGQSYGNGSGSSKQIAAQAAAQSALAALGVH